MTKSQAYAFLDKLDKGRISSDAFKLLFYIAVVGGGTEVPIPLTAMYDKIMMSRLKTLSALQVLVNAKLIVQASPADPSRSLPASYSVVGHAQAAGSGAGSTS